MLKFNRESILPALSQMAGLVSKRQTLPILANVLIQPSHGGMALTATDLEVEFVETINDVQHETETAFTVNAGKLLDICKLLPKGADIKITLDETKAKVTSGKSKFSIATLPADDYPCFNFSPNKVCDILVESSKLKTALQNTMYAMAVADVRHFLNGLLFELSKDKLNVAGSDGSRLATSTIDITDGIDHKIIVPFKAVITLAKLLDKVDTMLDVQIYSNSMRVAFGDKVFSTKLIDGRYPDFSRSINREKLPTVMIDNAAFKDALRRASTLANPMHHGVTLAFTDGLLTIKSYNANNEESEDEVAIDYVGENKISFSSVFLLDMLNHVEAEHVPFTLSADNGFCLVDDGNARHVVMPMRM